jgi:WD40 repeat protein/DNA-binding SARP family transcriptional activator/serine/threonine protein kinase
VGDVAERAVLAEVPGSPPGRVEVGLLGPLTLARDGQPLTLTGPKRQALLVLLALNVGQPLGRERIVDALWPEERTGREGATLRVHVSHLRDVLEPTRDAAPRILVTTGRAYVLDPERVKVDVTSFDQLVREARSLLTDDPDAAVVRLDRALGLWRGRPLQDVEYEDLAQDPIRRLEAAREHAVEDRAEALVLLGRDTVAIDDLEALVRGEPTRERPVRLLMTAYHRTGRQPDALRVLRRHTRHLAEQGLDPSPRLRELETRILRHDPALDLRGTTDRGGREAGLGPGRTVRGYELRERVGAGPAGAVYRAYQPAVGREVAVKVIRSALLRSPAAAGRFDDEARRIAALEHPHLVPLHDVWREGTRAYLVTRWMQGGNLAARAAGPWTDADLARLAAQLTDALGYAHDSGIVHGAIGPNNVLFDGPGNGYLGDLALATLVDPAGRHPSTGAPPDLLRYVAPEVLRRGPPSVASDVFSLGMVLGTLAAFDRSLPSGAGPAGPLREVVTVATAPDPADRYPDASAFRAALGDLVGPLVGTPRRRARRNPYRGLAAFTEADRADFHGRDDVVEALVRAVAGNGLIGVIGASGSGKSSVVLAGLLPALRAGAVPGSERWTVVRMVPGTDPFEGFHDALREVAATGVVSPEDTGPELRLAIEAVLTSPDQRALLVVDQFEEIFSSGVEPAARERFLDGLLDLAVDPIHRVRIVLTLRADLSERALGHPRFGGPLSRGSVLLAPMHPDEVEEVIRRPAARVGVEVEPRLLTEIVRDVATATAYLPLLQYVLTELFERRTGDRLTVADYRELGGIQGVLERRAETTFAALSADAKEATRQLFVRMVHLGAEGEETRRRLPLTELHGLGERAAVDAALAAFSAVRLLTYDRDPVTRAPTVELAHETVVHRWGRYRAWLDAARSDLLTQRRLATAASSWSDAEEDAAFLLTGGPLTAAVDLVSRGAVALNDRESRFVAVSQVAEEARQQHEEERRGREARLEQRAKRRLEVGVVAMAVLLVVAAVAAFALVERQRANDLAAAQERHSVARSLAAAAVTQLTSADPELPLLLALEGARQSTDVGEDPLPEVVDALHRAVITPRPVLVMGGGRAEFRGQVLGYGPLGTFLAVLAADGGVLVLDPLSGDELARLPSHGEGIVGIDVHPDGLRVLARDTEGVRVWTWRSGELTLDLGREELGLAPAVEVTTAAFSRDGADVAIGTTDGTIVLRSLVGADQVVLAGHRGPITTVDLDPTGQHLVSGGDDGEVIFWDRTSLAVVAQARTETVVLPIWQVAWHPTASLVAVTTAQGEIYLLDAETGERLQSYGNGQHLSRAVAFDPTGTFLVAAGIDGFARVFGTWVGGEPFFELPTGGVPLLDAAFQPAANPTRGGIATVGLDGEVRIWRDLLRSELRPLWPTNHLYPHLTATPDGRRFVLSANGVAHGVPEGTVPTLLVVDADTRRTLLSRPTRITWDLSRPAISRDGSAVAFAGPSGDVEVVDVDRGSTLVTFAGSSELATTLSFDDEGVQLAGAGTSGSIAIWNVTTGALERQLSGHGPGTHVSQVAFRPGSSELASAGDDGTLRVWDTRTGEGRVLRTFDDHVFSVAYAPDGSVLAAADRRGTIVVVDADGGDVVLVPDEVSGRTDLVVSPDGRTLAGAGPGPFAHLWDLETGRLVRRLGGAAYHPRSVAFVNGGTELRVASGEGILRGYVLDPHDLVELARDQVTRTLTDEECERYLRRGCA